MWSTATVYDVTLISPLLRANAKSNVRGIKILNAAGFRTFSAFRNTV